MVIYIEQTYKGSLFIITIVKYNFTEVECSKYYVYIKKENTEHFYKKKRMFHYNEIQNLY